MSDDVKFLDGFIDEILYNLHTCMPARIETFDPETMKAEVVPLFKKKFKGVGAMTMPKIVEVPVAFLRAGGFIIRPPLKKDDMVLLLFSDRALDAVINTGEEADPGHVRKHALDDAIVIAGLLPFVDKLPGEYATDLVIAKEDFSARIIIKENSDIIAETDGNIYLGSAVAAEGVPLGDSLKDWLDGHTHPDTSAPTSSSPAPSKKVFTA